MNAISQRLGARLIAVPHTTIDVQLISYGIGSRNDFGEWIRGTPTTTDAKMVPYPLSGSDRATLPEGLREQDGHIFLTALQAKSITAGEADGDTVRLNPGEDNQIDYLVVEVDDWGGFSRLVCVLPEAEPEDEDEDE